MKFKDDMKNIFYFLFVLSAFAPFCFGQNETSAAETQWIRIEGERKEVSVSLPSDFLVNAESVNYRKNYRIIGFYRDVKMEFSISKPRDPKQTIKLVMVADQPELSGISFEFNGLAGKNFVSKAKHYSNIFYLASDDYLYRISVSAKTDDKTKIEQNEPVARFIHSIKVKGQRLIVPETERIEPAEKSVLASTLKTSPEVSEALKRKPDKTKIKITYQPESALPKDEDEKFERPAIILARPLAGVSREALGVFGGGKVALRITLLANGQVGDVTVFSDAPKMVIARATGLLKDIKFIPAQIDGKAVDSQQTFKYIFGNDKDPI